MNNTLTPVFILPQMDEVIDNIISMQSSYDDIQGYIDPVQMPNTVSGINPASRCYSVLYTTTTFKQNISPFTEMTVLTVKDII